MTENLIYILPLVILQGIFFIYCLMIIVNKPVRFLPKWLWGILCLNTLGCILFLTFGRGEE